MIKYTKGNILKEQTEAIVNTVNCVGVMGRGIALQFRELFPKNYKEYKIACKNNEVQPGKMFIHQSNLLINPKYIINFPTKRHWKGKSSIKDIESGLYALAEEIKTLNIKSIAIPPLGCGLGGLDWQEVKEKIEGILKDLEDIEIIIYEPNKETNLASNNKAVKVPEMTAGRAALIELINRYLNALMDPFVTLLEIHKLMYFMQEAGQPLQLNYKKAIYGPYAENLRYVLQHVEGYFLCGYDNEDTPNKQLSLVPGAIKEAQDYFKYDKITLDNFKKVSDLVEGFETPFGLELLATVHWVTNKENASSLEEVVKKVYKWNDRKKQFSERQISIAYNLLVEKNWVFIK
ncbi:MAG: macro domain-containing protein [Candidatus Gastranaerophilales bacterium]|nr:macro domain-containing protein [Candidatus Gastranaerophilales bacterium]